MFMNVHRSADPLHSAVDTEYCSLEIGPTITSLFGYHSAMVGGPILRLLHLLETPVSEFLVRHVVIQEFP